jgi:hypothetical protein
MPGEDVTVDDLLSDETTIVSDDADDDGDDSTAEFLEKVFDTLDERGYLDAMVTQGLDLDGEAANVPNEATGGGSGGDPTSGGGVTADDLDAGTVATFGKVVIDEMGDVPISKVVKLAESNPQMVNQAIQHAVSGGEQ